MFATSGTFDQTFVTRADSRPLQMLTACPFPTDWR